MTSRGTLIINADDLGVNSQANHRILECMRGGLITSATIMANMPAFDEAVDALSGSELANRVGVHLNFDAGPALSPEMRALSSDGNLFCDRRFYIRDAALRRAVEAEARAQAAKVIQSGIRPTHFDSHHHLHTHFSITMAVLRVAREMKIPYVRLAGNMYFPRSPAKVAYRTFINSLIRARGLAGTSYFSYLDRFLPHSPNLGTASAELMVHPELDEDFRLLHSDEYAALRASYTLISYSDLKRTRTP